MTFQSLNELGEIKRAALGQPLFRFDYTNPFYGRCSFTATIVESKDRSLILDEGSIVLQEHQIRKGTLQTVLKVAKSFFTQVLVKHRKIGQLETAEACGETRTGLFRGLTSVRLNLF